MEKDPGTDRRGPPRYPASSPIRLEDGGLPAVDAEAAIKAIDTMWDETRALVTDIKIGRMLSGWALVRRLGALPQDQRIVIRRVAAALLTTGGPMHRAPPLPSRKISKAYWKWHR